MRIVAAIAGALFVALALAVRAEARMIRTLRHAGAVSPETAIRMAVWHPMVRLCVRFARKAGAVHRTDGRLYYLDRAGWHVWHQRWQGNALQLGGIILAVLAAFWALTRLG